MGIVSYPTPQQPFDVWQVDLLGPLPTTYRGNLYIFTASCMFSKYLFALAIPNKDAITVSEALFTLFTSFGVCHTILSDHGTEFIATVTKEVCRLMGIAQQFTPSFTHHCLGACERTHRTIEERLTPFVEGNKRNWDVQLSSIVFAINQSVNTSTGFSPYEVIFGSRPKFPLLPVNVKADMNTFPTDTKDYLQSFLGRLENIRSQVLVNSQHSKDNMTKRVNSSVHSMDLQKGDYVYLMSQPTGVAQKLQNKYTGPFIVQSVLSDHRVLLVDDSGKHQGEAVHINRLKMAYVRQPSPQPYLLGKVVSRKDIGCTHRNIASQTEPHIDNSQNTAVTLDASGGNQQSTNHKSRPIRKRRKPLRYRDSDHVSSLQSASDSGTFYKVKRILGQRTMNGKTEYLVHFSGEPAQNAIWTAIGDLNPKMQSFVKNNPPPVLQ
ncbi:hypothetical protein FSP39_009117 [Pinctada imbricata]|nr:hypothetical protein FSP39_009117 [Pinctada imbricata]